MQVSSYNPNFQGIYKLRTSNNGAALTKFLNNSDFVLRTSKPFVENNETYAYAVTYDGLSAEAFFENDLRKNKISFWKSLPIEQIINREIITHLFEENKKLSGKELWMN